MAKKTVTKKALEEKANSLLSEYDMYKRLYIMLGANPRTPESGNCDDWLYYKQKEVALEGVALVKQLISLEDGEIQKEVRKSKYFKHPERFLKVGDQVVAKRFITEAYTIGSNLGTIARLYANPGELGVVTHVEKRYWPTVKFTRTGRSTVVTDREVELKPKDETEEGKEIS